MLKKISLGLIIVVAIAVVLAVSFFSQDSFSGLKTEDCGILDTEQIRASARSGDITEASRPADCLYRNLVECNNAKMQFKTEDSLMLFSVKSRGSLCSIGNAISSDSGSRGVECDYPKDIISSLSYDQLIKLISSPSLSIETSEIKSGTEIKTQAENPATGEMIDVVCRFSGDFSIIIASGSKSSSGDFSVSSQSSGDDPIITSLHKGENDIIFGGKNYNIFVHTISSQDTHILFDINGSGASKSQVKLVPGKALEFNEIEIRLNKILIEELAIITIQEIQI